jgi:uncharacterized OB-fold protein
VSKPIPNLPDITNPLTAPFWAAAKRRELVAQRCEDCGDLRFPALEICPKCWSRRQTWTPITPAGRLWSYVVYRRALDPTKVDDVPYVIGRVRTDDGPVYTVRIDVSPEDAKVDMPVKPTWDAVNDEVTLLRFAPA